MEWGSLSGSGNGLDLTTCWKKHQLKAKTCTKAGKEILWHQ